jgi:hypothetical protein
MTEQHDRLSAFLAALADVDPQAFVSPPGIGGTWRAKHILDALEREILVIEAGGTGLCFRVPRKHGVCPECAARKGGRQECRHCACDMCAWERRAEERSSPPVSPERRQALMTRLSRFRMGAEVRVLNLDEDFK